MYKLLAINKYFLYKFKNNLQNLRVIFAGHNINSLPIYLQTKDTMVYTNQYDYYLWLKKILHKKVFLNMLNIPVYYNVLIFFWTKNKRASVILFTKFASNLLYNSDIFIIRENNNGIKSINNINTFNIIFYKIISVRKCSIYRAIYKKEILFNINDYWEFYIFKNSIIYNLSSIFNSNKLDLGSKLLITILQSHIQGKVLDLGCSSGIITTILFNSIKIHKTKLYAVNKDAKAIFSTEKTLLINHIYNVNVFPSNLFPHINDTVNLIISNPPFHNGNGGQYFLNYIYTILSKKNKYTVFSLINNEIIILCINRKYYTYN
ncbi:methyltransferase [Enterobacteriaceae endosymbiont of Macroplea appendiculata]|uniref:methyltransferase n=1 Tax=Enterobacteriaceae endosymbiont of Macroplea appendiculata TaxID=2675790 RepID=UPI001449B1E1|nr:methyltransferase [Enterobacteriaceae endosymbiont of Macroplea appendiculata]QJC30783.1 methyltransferase [Enterobacteriaceae endosymbiont of Macroplea appendiculata]